MAILLLHEGRTITDVHHLTGAARSTIGRWLRWYRDEGVGALEALPAGRAPILRIPVNLNSDSGICEHHFRKVCGQGFCEQKLSFEGRHLFDSPNKPAAKRSAAVVDPGHWSMTVHLTSEFVL